MKANTGARKDKDRIKEKEKHFVYYKDRNWTYGEMQKKMMTKKSINRHNPIKFRIEKCINVLLQ